MEKVQLTKYLQISTAFAFVGATCSTSTTAFVVFYIVICLPYSQKKNTSKNQTY